ncbi:hypothetical protein H0H93_014672 [Arthromyces matolae]|nr:hypothetical protein H0H93_014672 [Arthromyces matolae]
MLLKMLKEAALSPRHFISLMSSAIEAKKRSVRPRRVQVLNPVKGSQGNEHHFQSIHLIPGGRYLLTIRSDHEGNSEHIDLWDLGLRALNDINPDPVASLKWIGLSNWNGLAISHIAQTSDGLGFAIVGYFGDPEGQEGSLQINVFTVYPLCGNPKFELVATMVVEEGANYRGAAGPLYAYVNSSLGQVSVWNFETNESVTWNHDVSDISGILLKDKHIILFDCSGFKIFAIPPLSPCVNNTLNPPLSQHVPFLVHYEHPPNRIYQSMRLCELLWCPQQDLQNGGVSFAITADIDEPDEVITVFDYYTIPAVTLSQATNVDSTLFLASSVRRPDVELDESEITYVSGEKAMIILNLENPAITLHLATIELGSHKKSSESVEIWSPSYEDMEDGIDEYAFCPATGRSHFKYPLLGHSRQSSSGLKKKIPLSLNSEKSSLYLSTRRPNAVVSTIQYSTLFKAPRAG